MNRRSFLLVAGMALLGLPSCRSHSAPTGGPDPSSETPRFESAHWTCLRSREGGSIGNRPTARFEVWFKGRNALIAATVGGGDRLRVLRLNNETYSWKEGDSKGLHWIGLPTDERRLVAPSVDYMYRAEPCRTAGKKLNSGTIDGHPMTSYACVDAADDTRRVYSFASDLLDFPIRASITYPDGSRITYEARSVEIPASVPDAMLELPRGIQFEPFDLGKPQ